MVEDTYNGKSFMKQILRGQYFMVFATLLILTFTGTSYIFGLYSNDIKRALDYEQTTLNLLSFFKVLGGFVSIHAGLIYEVTPTWMMLLLGGSLHCFGYLMIWLSITHQVSKPSVWKMCVYIFLGANASAIITNGAMVTCVKNFPSNRGIVIGVLNGYLGLGGAIISQMYHLFHNGSSNNNVGIILLISWLTIVVILAFSHSIRIHNKVNDRERKKESKFFYNILYISLVLALFLMVINIVQNKVEFTMTKRWSIGTFFITMLLLLLPLVLAIKEECNTLKSDNIPKELTIPSSSIVSFITTTEEPNERVSLVQETFNPPPVGEDHTILQANFRIEMQILHIASICGIGGQITMIDNLGQIGSSLGYSKSSIANFVSLTSICQFLGRVLGGLISDHLLTRYKCPRSLFFTLILLFSSIGHLLIALNVPYGLYVASSITGFCLGAELTLLYTMVSEIFGLKYFSTLYNYAALGAPLGSYIFNVKIMGTLYDNEGMRQLQALGLQRKHVEFLNCEGLQCFQMSFIILAVATLFSTFASLILVVRTWKFYRNFQVLDSSLDETLNPT